MILGRKKRVGNKTKKQKLQQINKTKQKEASKRVEHHRVK